MFYLTEYRKKPDRLADFLPWLGLIAPGVIVNKDGSFQKTYKFRGPDLFSATETELIAVSAQVNNVFKRFEGGWAIFVDAIRFKSKTYPTSVYPDPVTYLIDRERKAFFDAGNHYESKYFLTLLYLPPPDNQDKITNLFIERNMDVSVKTGRMHLRNFQTECDRAKQLLKSVMCEFEELTDEETLTYLHQCVSTKDHNVIVPEAFMDLDAVLADSPLVGGLEPKLGNKHIRTVTIQGFPGTSIPGLLNGLNQLGFEYRWSTRFLPMDKQDAINEIKTIRRKQFAGRLTVFQTFMEALTGRQSPLQNTDAINKANDADIAYQAVADDLVSCGYYTASVTVMNEDYHVVERQMREVEKVIHGRGFTTIYERSNAVEAWLGSLPGHTRANVRRPMISTLNLAHLIPISAIWAGPEKNKHLNGPAVIYTQTLGYTPFRLDNFVRDVGHMAVIGPTGMGKSAFLALLAAQFRRYPESEVKFFDKDGSIRALTAGVGGDFYDLANEENGALSFQPLANIDDDKERSWAAKWLEEFLISSNIPGGITPERRALIWDALNTMANTSKSLRHMTALVTTLQDTDLRQAFKPLATGGAYGHLFDAREDKLTNQPWQVFEMGQLMQTPQIVPAALSYLFHRLEQSFNGKPKILILDECWLLFDNPLFADKIREWLKVARKWNVSVVFATQSVQDVLDSKIAPTVMDSCPTKIFLPNPNARDEEMAKAYRRFGLNSREIEIISMATGKKHYYYKSEMGSRLFELALGKFTLAYCGASTKEDQAKVRELLQTYGKDGFNVAWLSYKAATFDKDLLKFAQKFPSIARKVKGGSMYEKVS